MRVPAIAMTALLLLVASEATAQRIVRPGPAADTVTPAGAYRRLAPGYALPPAWQAPRFVISDWRAIGLPPPPRGYRWTRYHDDAVLVDRNGSVRDVVEAVDWNGDADPYRLRDDTVYAGPGERGGMDRAHRLADHELAELPVAPERAPPPPPRHRDDWVSNDGRTVVSVREQDHDRTYDAGGATIITIQSAPAVTTTTEVYEDAVTYSRPPARKIMRKKAWRPRSKLRCDCNS